MQSLQAQLDAITTQTRALVPAERLEITDRFIQELHASGIESRILPVGSIAPEFALHDALTGKLVRSADLLALGVPVILKFFRGRWCPYDVTELEAWQELYPALRPAESAKSITPGDPARRGPLFVALSPQLPRQNDFLVGQHNLTFPVLSDPGAQVASAFGLTYTVPEPMQRHFRSIMVNVPFVNGDQSWTLPLPATYVISPEGTVLFAEAFADHRVRPDLQDVLAALSSTGQSSAKQSTGVVNA